MADAASQDYLGALMDLASTSMPTLELSIKSFINADGSVDSELRFGNLPDEWRDGEGTPALMAFLSQMLRVVGTLEPDAEGGKYWISIGVRFGPQDESEAGELAELYKRHRGMFQVASHALQTDMTSGLQNAVVSIGTIVKSLQSRRGLPPSVIFIRITWLPVTDTRPHRYEGEKGGGY